MSVNGRDGPAVLLHLGPWLRRAIASWRHFFLNLQDLVIAIHPAMNYSWMQVKSEEIVHLIKDIARLCGPSLESYSRSLPPIQIDAEDLAGAFALFPKMKSITICQKLIGKGSPDEYALTLAASCPLLESVSIEEEEVFEGAIFAQSLQIGRYRDPNSPGGVFIKQRRSVRFPIWDQQPYHVYL